LNHCYDIQKFMTKLLLFVGYSLRVKLLMNTCIFGVHFFHSHTFFFFYLCTFLHTHACARAHTRACWRCQIKLCIMCLYCIFSFFGLILQSISPYSGHYRPTDDRLDSFLSLLKENGVNLNEVQVIFLSDHIVSISCYYKKLDGYLTKQNLDSGK
jgi:hypothetical protein